MCQNRSGEDFTFSRLERITMAATTDQLKLQLHNARATGIFALLQAGASQAGLPLAFVLAIGSRETNLTNELGDGGHGHGVLQIDDRYHSIARDCDIHADCAKLINYGCNMLAQNEQWAKRQWPAFTDAQHLKIAASAYNAGEDGAGRGVVAGDADLHTTGGNYGADVMCRKAIFEELLKL